MSKGTACVFAGVALIIAALEYSAEGLFGMGFVMFIAAFVLD